MRTRALAIPLGMTVAFTGITATAAHAYDNSTITVSSWQRYTSECPCSNSTGVDYTEFKYDAGGEGLKLVVKKSGVPVAQVEFHPSDELLYVYDGKNDGDSVFVHAFWWDGNGLIKDEATYWAPGTSAAIDMNVIEMDGDDDLDEGTKVYFQIFDDKELTDELTTIYRYNATA
ncbi:hypothetical protein ACIBI4_20980 [Streptomyces sp. NPDC050418]|uniref:hypothetical protein n=1 Tax=Streptomyces sp. NPDC050418 TaxID=3365612 RepID=UPI0037B1765A